MSLSLPNSSGASLARRSPSPRSKSDPTAGLEIALAQFGANLTDDERKRLSEQKSGLNDADAAFKFTLELDELDPVRRGRVAASKLCSLLQTVQIFGQVVDTYVSSNPEIAALIWGSLKLTFMVLINFTSYFHKFTDLLHGFQHLMPHFEEYESLFPNSDGLKTSICQFHLAVVSCCTQIVNITRLPWMQKALTALTQSFESKIRPAVDDIRTAAKRVKDAIGLAKAQYDRSSQVEQEKTQKSLLKQSLRTAKNVSRLEKRHKSNTNTRKRESLLNMMSSYSYETAYKNARSKRHKGTAEWIFETQQFQKWFLEEQNAVLYIAGKIGSGKTVLTANVIDYVKRHKTAQTFVSFFFIRFDDIESQDPDAILRSIIRQSLARQSFDGEFLGLLEEIEHSGFDHQTLLDLFVRKAKLVEDNFIILDGLDECSPKHQSDVLQTLAAILQSTKGFRIKILVSARESVAEKIHHALPSASRLIVGSEDTDRDLLCYAQGILREKEEQDWGVGDKRLIDEILEAISSGGDGMFLWVFLTIEDICTRRSDDEIRKALTGLPRDLPAVFNRVLQRIEQKKNAETAQSIFKWILAARNPLTLSQIEEVLLIKPNQPDSKASQRVNGIHYLPSWCENLVHVEKDTDTVHFSHHSIRTFLLDNTEKPSGFSFDSESCNHEVGEICLTYLHFSDFQRALTRQTKPLPLAQVSLGVVDQTLRTFNGNCLVEGVSQLIKMPFGQKRPQSSQNRFFQGLLSYNDSGTAQDHPYLPYAKQNWIYHTKEIKKTSSTWNIWRNIDLFAEYAPWTDLAWQPPELRHLTYDSSNPDANAKQDKFLLKHHLEPVLEGRRWFAFHKAIAYARVVGNFALAGKVSTHMSQRHMPLDLLLLENLSSTNLTYHSSGSVEESREDHKLFTVELLVLDGLSHSLVATKSPFSTCGFYRCSNQESHGILYRFIYKWISLPQKHGQCYLSAFQLWSRVCGMEFSENAFAEFRADFEAIFKDWVTINKDYHSFSEDCYCIVMDLGGQWPIRILQWLLTSSELWTPEHLDDLSPYVNYALKMQNEDVLKLLLEDTTWPTSTWFRHLHHRDGFWEYSSWLPRDLESRLKKICSLASRDENILHEALLNHQWEIATEMRESGAGAVGSRRHGGHDSSWVVGRILRCNYHRGEKSCILEEGNGTLRLCDEHRRDSEWKTQGMEGDSGRFYRGSGALVGVLKYCLDMDGNQRGRKNQASIF